MIGLLLSLREHQRNRLPKVLSRFFERWGLSVRAGQLLDECNVTLGYLLKDSREFHGLLKYSLGVRNSIHS